MPRYGYGQGADPTELQQLSGNPFYNPTSPNPDWVRGLQYLYANLQGAKDKKKSEQQQAEDRKWKQMLTEAQIKNYGETSAGPQPTAIQERIALFQKDPVMYKALYPESGANTDQYTFPEENYPMIEKKLGLVKGSLKASTPKFRQDAFQRFNDIANPKTNTQAGAAAWRDEATNLNKLITAKISNVDKEIERYNGYSKKAKEELTKYGSMKNKLAGQKSIEAKQSSDEATRAIRMLELYKKQMMAHQTNINPDKPVDELTKSAVLSDYPKTISDIIYGGQNLDLGASPELNIPDVPGELDQRTIRRNGAVVNQIYKNGGWVDIKGK